MNQTYRHFFWFSFWVWAIVTTIQNYLDQSDNFHYPLLKFVYSAPLTRRWDNGKKEYIIKTCAMSKKELIEFLNKKREFCSNLTHKKNDYLVCQMQHTCYGWSGTFKIYLSCIPFPIEIPVARLIRQTNYITVIPYPYTNEKKCTVTLRWKNMGM